MFSEITSRIAVASAHEEHPSGWESLDVRGLIDGPGNSAALVGEYVENGLRILEKPGAKLLVVCDYGQSRSNFIAALIHARIHSLSLDDALNVVRAAHPDSKIKTSLLHQAATRPRNDIGRIAITGGRGFVGQKLSAQLANGGYDCLILTRSKSGDYLRTSESLRDALGGYEPDLLIHFAHPKPYNSEPTLQEALSQAISVATYCEDDDVRLMYPSGWVVFDGVTNGDVTSVSPTRPHTKYGRLKVAIESYLAAASQERLNARIIRLPGIFGMESLEPRFLRYFADCVSNDVEIVFHEFDNGSTRVPLVDVDACVRSVAGTVARFDELPLITHVGRNDQSPSVRDIAIRLSDSTGIRVKGTRVERATFAGYFSPDICVTQDCPVGIQINEFILQLCRNSHGIR